MVIESTLGRDNTALRKEYGVGMCVVMAIDSMLSEVAGCPITIAPNFVELRKDRLGRIYNMDSRHPLDPISLIYGVHANSPEGKRRWTKIRMDTMWIREFMGLIADGDDPAGTILRQNNISYRRGTLLDASSFVDQGISVGVISATSELNGSSAHIFHLGKIDSQLADMSSNDLPQILEEHEVNYHSRETRRVAQYTRSWNLLLISAKLP